jgi:hypothetical protein
MQYVVTVAAAVAAAVAVAVEWHEAEHSGKTDPQQTLQPTFPH